MNGKRIGKPNRNGISGVYKKGMAREISNEMFEVTKILKNLAQHNFDIADYKMCKQEADVTVKALTLYFDTLENGSWRVTDVEPTV